MTLDSLLLFRRLRVAVPGYLHPHVARPGLFTIDKLKRPSLGRDHSGRKLAAIRQSLDGAKTMG